jgi:hypothetical protein
LETVEQWARESRNPVINGSPVDELIHGPCSRHGADGNLAVELPNLQKALQRYGATYAPQKFEPTRLQRNPYRHRYCAGRGAPYGRGGMYDGLGVAWVPVVVLSGRNLEVGIDSFLVVYSFL